ncbi:hypothetical protein [Citricoccus sp. K5]|uniref:hypothetical protein n=1 Tax=Citricoccus sp. K5 TaxID=2653135 RepID=UPI0012F26829|nr:hypothetical protein [Citricoccus sp. K5]VXA92905.1 hypothetical protein CITRIK5_100039 [Citricoccus sp. K5]VXA95457.1 hypothetical protein CITRIK5_100105 [Citricoccus sp. K5]
MSNAGKIIDKLTGRYQCVARGCTTGIVALTMAPKWVQERDDEQMVYQCHKCGALWYQNGESILWPEPEEELTP